MVRRRIPVLVGTIALLAGCGSSSRVEVSGVVRDRDTGRAISGALIVAADGSSTRTDDEGRFVLSVLRSEHRSIRASAALHEDAVDWIDSHVETTPMSFELAPTVVEPIGALVGGPRIEDDDPDAVLRWVRESWLDDRTNDGGTEGWRGDAERSTHLGAFAAVHLETHAGDGSACASCHEAQAALVGMTSVGGSHEAGVTAIEAPHARLAGGCTACHGERSADGVAMRASAESDLEAERCAGCHGDRADAALASLAVAEQRAEAAFARALGRIERCGQTAARLERLDGNVVLVDARGLPLGDCDASGAIDGSEIAIGIEVLEPSLMHAAEDILALRGDDSGGVHQPALTLARSRRVAWAASHSLALP